MPARRIAPGDYSPPQPELRHLFGSFAELRARIRARRGAVAGAVVHQTDDLDPESLRRATASPRLIGGDAGVEPDTK
jgi:hypothetical protein